MLIGFIASVKSGHPYIPVDSSLPRQRVLNIVETAQASLFTAEELADISVEGPVSLDRPRLAPGDIWYIIFTSGSTGDPKGVMITRGCLESFVSWILEVAEVQDCWRGVP